MSQVVAYKRLKTMKRYNAIKSKSGRCRLREVVSSGRLLELPTIGL